MISVQDIMTTDVVTVEPSTDIKDIVKLLLSADVNGLPVVDIGEVLVGVVTQADVLSKAGYPDPRTHLAAVAQGNSRAPEWTVKAQGLTAEEIMTTEVATCHPSEDVHLVARRMLNGDLKFLPVVAAGRLVGVVARSDILATFDRPDADIAADIERFLAAPLWAAADHDVHLSVDDGVVVLSGRVRYRAYAQVVVDFARHVRGVVGVLSHLEADHED